MSGDLAVFLAARYSEAEALAVAAAKDAGRLAGRAHWAAAGSIVTDAEDPDWAVCDLSPYVEDDSLAAHIAACDPAHRLADITLKRAILDRYQRAVAGDLPEWAAGRELVVAAIAILEGVLRLLGTEFDGHPEYEEKWMP